MAGLPVTAYAPDCAVARDIRAVAAELVSSRPGRRAGDGPGRGDGRPAGGA